MKVEEEAEGKGEVGGKKKGTLGHWGKCTKDIYIRMCLKK